jgi:hypothetical protein
LGELEANCSDPAIRVNGNRPPARRREGAEALLKAIEAGKGSARRLQERRVVIGLEPC